MDDKTKKYKSVISIILPFILGVIPLIIIIVMYADIKDYRFLIAAIIEIGLAFACYTFRRYSYWMYNIIFLFSFFVPILLAVKISQLRPIGASILVFLATLIAIHAWTKYFRRVINRTNSPKLSPKFPFIAIFPNNLLPDFMMGEYFIYKKKKQTTLEIIYENDNNRSTIWIKESDGEIISTITQTTQKTDKIINGTTVSISQEIPKRTKIRKTIQNLYLEAIWSHKGVNFDLYSEGISSEYFEKIIESMII